MRLAQIVTECLDPFAGQFLQLFGQFHQGQQVHFLVGGLSCSSWWFPRGHYPNNCLCRGQMPEACGGETCPLFYGRFETFQPVRQLACGAEALLTQVLVREPAALQGGGEDEHYFVVTKERVRKSYRYFYLGL